MSLFRTVTRRWASGRTRRYVAVGGTVLGIALFIGFAPAALGGNATYVTTYGTSMEPVLHDGDLVVVRPQESYQVGDVVAYRSENLEGTIVLHRIIGREGEHYVLKGDNNSWIDEDRPTEEDLVGRMDTSMGGMGERLQHVHSPVGLSVLVGLGVVPTATARKRRRGRDKRADRSHRPRPSVRAVDHRLLAATGAVLLVTGYAFTQPTAVDASNDVPYDDRGAFAYTGAAPGGAAAYPTEVVTSGQPVFLNLVDEIDISFHYDVSSTAPVDASGEIVLRGELADLSGWSYPFELAPPVVFTGAVGDTSGTLDLDDLRARIDAMEAATGTARDMYTVRIVADVDREITAAGATSAGTFSAVLELKLQDLELGLAAPGEDALTPTQGGLLTTAVQRPGTITMLGQALPTSAVRGGAVAVLVLLVALVGQALLGSTRGGDESRFIQRRYRSYLLPLRSMELRESTVVDVDSIAALARVADHTAGPILTAGPGGGSYYVVDGQRVFRYRTSLDVEGPVAPTSSPARTRPARTEPLRARAK